MFIAYKPASKMKAYNVSLQDKLQFKGCLILELLNSGLIDSTISSMKAI